MNDRLPVQEIPDDESSFLDIWRAIRMRLWPILAMSLLVSLVTGFVVSQRAPVYRSTATIMVESSKFKVTSIEDVYSNSGAQREYVLGQTEALKSLEVARRVIERLGLSSHPEFDPSIDRRPRWQMRLIEWVPALESYFSFTPPADRRTHDTLILPKFAANLVVQPVPMSNVLKVSFNAQDPVMAAAVANEVVEQYVRLERENKSSVTSGAGQFINQRLADLKRKLDTSERALQQYREQEDLLSRKAAPGGSSSQLDQITTRLVEAQVRRTEIEETYKQIKGGKAGNYDSVPAVARNPVVMRAREQEVEAERKFAEVSQRYGPEHPRYSAAETDLKTARASTRKQTDDVVESIVREYNAAVANEKSLQESVGQNRTAAQSQTRKEIRLAELEREVTTNSQLYETFLSRMKETTATAGVEQPVARILDRAQPSIMPVGIGRVRVIAAAFGLSLLAGLVAATILRQLNNTVNTTEEVESRLGVGLLSALPKLGLLAGRKISRAVDLQPTSGFSEAIRTAVTGIAMSSLDSPRKIVAVTSTLPDEGKSTTAENLALFNAKMKPTVLVEADLRKPVIAESLELARNGPARPGLSELLAGMASLDDCLQSVDGSELKVIAAGIIPPNPLEMVSSMAFGRVIAELSERFEMVIIDTPPIQPVSDVLMISKHVTGVVYVVKSNVTPVPMIRRSLKRLAEAGAPLIGIVLNQHDYRKAERYYGEYSGYGRYGYKDYYGGGYGKSRRKASGPSKRVDGPVPSDQGGKAA